MLNWICVTQATVIGTLLGFGVGLLSPPAIANYPANSDPPPNTRGRSAGSRGCSLPSVAGNTSTNNSSLEEAPALILLAPDRMGKTVSTQPTFAWFSRYTDIPVTFRLYEYDDAGQTYHLLAETLNKATHSGILLQSLPSEIATLSLGQRYLWQVELVCDRNRPSGNLFAEAEFEVTEPSATLAEALANAATDADKAAIYAAEDLWYDALSMTLTADISVDEAMDSLRSVLFSQVTLTDAEQVRFENSSVYWME
ncbi:MAG: DUF928 domain-containing protein [Cyanobacteria bacterium P01_F01_bin.4]